MHAFIAVVVDEVFILCGDFDLFFFVEDVDEVEFLGDLLGLFFFAEEKHGV